MGLRKTDGMATITVSEWNRKQAIRTIRNRIIVQLAVIIVGIAAVSGILYILHDLRIINLLWW